MDVSGIAGLSSALAMARTNDAAAVLIQKKAMDMESQSALALIQALPQPANNPPHLGQTVDVKA